MNVECLSVGILVADYLCAPIDHAPSPGELVMTDRLTFDVGGCASNTATDLARLGVRAIGATESVFSRAEAEAFIRNHTLRIEEF